MEDVVAVNCGGTMILLDPKYALLSYGALVLRVNPGGVVDMFIPEQNGGEWVALEEATPVTRAKRGKPS